jgi:CubicO group peptidase (beta-lactamase class C family)
LFGGVVPTPSTNDWLRLILARPMEASPGERWHYSSADAVLLGGALRATTGEPANDYARRTLFSSLGITDYTWLTGQPNGMPQTGSGLSLTAPDMARIGYLLLRKGQWQGTPLVTPAWVASMGERKSAGVVRWLKYSLDFGRMLWVLPAIPGGPATDAVAGTGIRGQWIVAVPSRDLVVVATGEARSVDEHAELLRLLYEVIVPAVR